MAKAVVLTTALASALVQSARDDQLFSALFEVIKGILQILLNDVTHTHHERTTHIARTHTAHTHTHTHSEQHTRSTRAHSTRSTHNIHTAQALYECTTNTHKSRAHNTDAERNV